MAESEGTAELRQCARVRCTEELARHVLGHRDAWGLTPDVTVRV